MKYHLLLTDKVNGFENEIVVPASMILEDLSVKIKLAMRLPLYDRGWHQFFSHGVAYVTDEYLWATEDILYENFHQVGPYRGSERVKLSQVFTVLQSVVTYVQEVCYGPNHRITCTLLERL